MTQGAETVRAIALENPDVVEPVEMMAEAALELRTGRHAGDVVFSRNLLHRMGRGVRSLDGKRLMGDAFMEADAKAAA